MASFATPYGLRCAAHCFNRAHTHQRGSALIPAGGRSGGHVTHWKAAIVTQIALKVVGLFCRSSRNRPANFRPAVSSIRITLLAYVGTAAASQKVASRTVYTCFSDRDIFTDLDYFARCYEWSRGCRAVVVDPQIGGRLGPCTLRQ